MATLIVTPFTPRTTSGRGLRTVGLARALARSGPVEVAYVEFDGHEPAPELAAEGNTMLTRLERRRGPRRARSYVRARRAGVPRSFARGISPELTARFRRARGYDRVIADGPIAAAAALLVADCTNVVYNAHNFESGFRNNLSGSRQAYGTREQFAAFERRLLEGATEAWLPSRRDVDAAAELAPRARIRLVPNVVDVAHIRPVRNRPEHRVLFVADHTYEPNRDAARLLVEAVMPRLWSRMPDARLVLVGRGIQVETRGDPRIEVVGFVDRVETAYHAADCAVVPLLDGGGSPLKMIEAMAYGLPIVASTAATRGIDGARAGTHYLLADGAEETSAALGAALGGQSDQLGIAAREFVQERYSIEALASVVRQGEGSQG